MAKNKKKKIVTIRQLRALAKNAIRNGINPLIKEVEQGPTEMRSYILAMFASGGISAVALSNLAWYITRAGGKGVEDLANDPEKVNNNKSRFINHKLGMDCIEENLLLNIAVPLRVKGKEAVRKHLPILPVYEVFARRFRKHEDQYMKHVGQPDLLCDNFHEHETVLEKGAENCFPLRAFIDFAKIYKRETTMNIFISCLHVPGRVID